MLRNLFITLSILLTSITSIIYHPNEDCITLTLNSMDSINIGFNYYLNNKFMKYEDMGEVTPNGIQSFDFKITAKDYDELSIELISTGEVNFESRIKLIKNQIDHEVDFSIVEEYSELIDIEYNLVDSVTINHLNKYKFKKMDNLLLPRILDVSKLTLVMDSYKDVNFNDCYLLFNKGFAGSALEKEYDFYKVPIIIKKIDSNYDISLKEQYYYDFKKGALTLEKKNDSISVNELILSRDDDLISEAYLVINEFGYYQNKINIDLLLKEQSFFGEDGYYQIKEVR